MPGSKSDYLEKALLDYVFSGVPLNLPATLYIALSRTAYSDAATGASMGEVVGNGYARAPMARDTTTWPPASGNPAQLKNGTPASFPAATGDWGTITTFYVVDAPTGGNVLYGSDLAIAKPITTGDTATFAANTITITED